MFATLPRRMRREFPEGRALARRFGHRTTLAAPLLREGVPLGAIMVRRKEVQPFSDKQIEILKTFADQAVIAIENVRLFTEIQERTRELEQSLEEVGALSEVSRAVSSSLDLGQVLHEIAEQAAKLCDADAGFIQEYVEEAKTFHISASWNAREEFVQIDAGRPDHSREGCVRSKRGHGQADPDSRYPDRTRLSFPGHPWHGRGIGPCSRCPCFAMNGSSERWSSSARHPVVSTNGTSIC